MQKIITGKKYRHFKGKIVEVLYIGKDSETLDDLVIYKHVDDNVIWVRPYNMFAEKLDKEKYKDIDAIYRFTEVEE